MRSLRRTCCLAVLVSNCGIKGDFVRLKDYAPKERSVAAMELFMEGEAPRRPVKIVGTITTDWTWKGLRADQEEVFLALRQVAAKNGLDGVTNIHCAGTGIQGQGLCSGYGFVYLE
jgi:hypothetical protein